MIFFSWFLTLFEYNYFGFWVDGFFTQFPSGYIDPMVMALIYDIEYKRISNLSKKKWSMDDHNCRLRISRWEKNFKIDFF